MFKDAQTGGLYFGDMRLGDRLATGAEIVAYEAARTPSFATLKAAEFTHWKTMRDQIFGRLASIEGRLRAAGDAPGADSCIAVANSLLGLFLDPAVAAATTISAYKLALVTKYDASVALVSVSAKAEFRKYDK